MVLKRMIPLIGIMLILAGCFRQADESFDTVNSQNVPQSNPATATQQITIIDPNATEVPPATVESQQLEPTETLVIINPQVEDATATEDQSFLAPPSSTPLTIPTATEITFVTPEAPVEVELPTATPVEEVDEPTLEPTPTVEDENDTDTTQTTSDSECEYIVQSGDNLFRIALNHGVSLNALLQENSLNEASIIQPGQVIRIPNCSDDGTTSVEPTPTRVPTEEPIVECQYVVVSGDTLYDIAIDLDVSLDDLLDVNSLASNSIILPDQVLNVPGCAGDEFSSLPDNMVDEVESEMNEAISNVTIHTITADDTLLSIAQLYGITVNDLIQNNSIPDPNKLSVGQQLLIPKLDN